MIVMGYGRDFMNWGDIWHWWGINQNWRLFRWGKTTSLNIICCHFEYTPPTDSDINKINSIVHMLYQLSSNSFLNIDMQIWLNLNMFPDSLWKSYQIYYGCHTSCLSSSHQIYGSGYALPRSICHTFSLDNWYITHQVCLTSSPQTNNRHSVNTDWLYIPGISVAAPIRRSTPWAFIRKNFPFVPTIEMSTLFSFPSKNQINAQGAVTENPGTVGRFCDKKHISTRFKSQFHQYSNQLYGSWHMAYRTQTSCHDWMWGISGGI